MFLPKTPTIIENEKNYDDWNVYVFNSIKWM